MSRKTLVVFIFGLFLLAACQTASPPPTETATPAASPTDTIAVTSTSSPTPTQPPPTETLPPTATFTPALPTNTPLPPTNAPDCANQASFVADVTVPDNSVIEAGMTFTKTWRVQNAGTCAWGPDYTLDYYSGDTLGFTTPISMPLTLPGETADISVRLNAPQEEGSYQANFVIKNPDGLIMAVDADSRLWVIINVAQGIKGVFTPTPTPTETATPAAEETAAPPAETATPQSNTEEGAPSADCPVVLDQAKVNAMVTAWNAYRTQNNLPPLPLNPLLNQAAQRHANDMACHELFYHYGSDGSTPTTRVAEAGYQATWVTENVYGSYPPLDGTGVVNWWATDEVNPQHNENLLTTKYTEAGVGYAFYNNFGYYVIVFAAP